MNKNIGMLIEYRENDKVLSESLNPIFTCKKKQNQMISRKKNICWHTDHEIYQVAIILGNESDHHRRKSFVDIKEIYIGNTKQYKNYFK